MEIPIAVVQGIREAGFDEYWLQDQIYDNPSCLGLGDLESYAKERRQSSGGRLDILLKDIKDDSMYEVEVMLGETDESHIIRTIEYWDNEKRRWPQRQHYAVLVAENVTSRFFNVIQLLSHSIPIIAIQVNLIDSTGQKCLHFSKILDTYEELDDVLGNGITYDEEYWKKRANWTLETAQAMLNNVGDMFDAPKVRFLKDYLVVSALGNNYFWIAKRKANKSMIEFQVLNENIEVVSNLLDEENISHIQKRHIFRITCDVEFIKKNTELIRQITEYVKTRWEK